MSGFLKISLRGLRKHDIYILYGMSISQALIEVNPVFRGNPVLYAFEAVTKTWQFQRKFLVVG